MHQVRHSFLSVMISDSLEWAVWGRGGVIHSWKSFKNWFGKDGERHKYRMDWVDWARSLRPVLLGLWVGFF